MSPEHVRTKYWETKLNILFLSTWYPHPPDNGSKLCVWYLLKALAARMARQCQTTVQTAFSIDLTVTKVEAYLEDVLRDSA